MTNVSEGDHGRMAGASGPAATGNFDADCAAFARYWLVGLEELDALPVKPERSAGQQMTAEGIISSARAARKAFLLKHAVTLYRELTADLTKHVRMEELVFAASDRVPGLVPTRERVETENGFNQKDKDGHEIDQGLFFNHVLADRECGLHLCHTMMLPRKEALALLPRLRTEDRIDLGTAVYERRGDVSVVYMKNPRYLNAEDDTTVDNVETAVDLALLDERTSIAVLRGAEVDRGKYQGKGVYCTGINLTELYRGNISYIWYLVREFGFINKIYRGLAIEGTPPDEIMGDTIEKPWVSLVEKFAIGGGCQYLLVCDYILAGSDAYMTLPARKEGIIPGAANLRMWKFTGDRITRQAVMYDRRIDCDSPEGRMICDEIVPPEDLERALEDVTGRLTNSGVVSASSNRRCFRIGAEPLDVFREYMAVYAREQAYCHFSPALISNLERFWNANQRAA